MKNLWYILLSLSLCLALMACQTGGNPVAAPREAATNSPAEDPQTEETGKAEKSVEERIPEAVEVAEPVPAGPSEQEVITAVQAYDLEGLKKLLAHVEDVKTIVGDHVLLLHMAEEAMGMTGFKNEMTAFLVSKKAYTLQLDEDGKSFERYVREMGLETTPRHVYIREVIGDNFQRLLTALREDSVQGIQAMADVMPWNDQLLLLAVEKKATAVATWLLEQGVPAEVSRDHQSLLHVACDNTPYTSRFEDRVPMVEALLAAGLPVDALDARGDTALTRLFLSVQNNVQNKMGPPDALLATLLKAGAEVNREASNGKTVLQMAAEAKEERSVEKLIACGARLDRQTLEAMNLTIGTIEALVKAGAPPANFTDNIQGNWSSEERYELLQFLLRNGASPSDFDLVHARNDENVLRYLIENGADVADSDILLNRIAEFRGMEPVVYLIEKGADLQRRYYKERTILHFAVQYSREEAVAYLIEKGAPLNSLDAEGKTALDYCKSRETGIMNTLITAGALKASEL